MPILSKFAFKTQKNGYIARYNSLKNIPVYYKDSLDQQVESYLNNGCNEKILNDEIESIIDSLKKNKVIVDNEEYDDSIYFAIQNANEAPYPSILYLILTEKCNFNCSYCFIERHMNPNKANIMTKEIAKKAIDFFCKQIKCDPSKFDDEKTILFYGGEPLSNFDVLVYACQLVNQYVEEGKLPKKTVLSMVTNGSLLTREKARLLKKLGVSFSISLDGVTEKANVARVLKDGTPAYNRIISGIENAKAEGLQVGLSITLSENALAEKEDIMSLIDKYDIKGIGFNILNTDKSFRVSDDYFEKASKFIIDSYPKFRTKGIYEDRIMRKVTAFTEHKLYYCDCGAEGGHQFVVAPNGEIGICQGFLSSRKTFITNVNDENFDILTNELYLEWNKRTPFLMPQCKTCQCLGICGGGCALCAYENGNSIFDLDEGFCIHSKMTLEFLIWDLFDAIRKRTESNENK